MKVALITALFAFLSLSIAQAQLPSTLIARDEQVGNLRLTVNGEVVIGMEKGACKVKVNSEKLELSSISQYDFNVYFADYSLESHTEGRGDFLNVYSINSIDLNSKAAQEACVNDKVASYTQVLYESPYDISVKETIVCSNSKKFEILETCYLPVVAPINYDR